MTEMRMRFALVEVSEGFDLDDVPELTVLGKSSHDPRPVEARMTHLAGMLSDLDRCEHGRHEGDDCYECGGPSVGNPIPADDRIIGYDISGRAIFIPRRGENWKYERPPVKEPIQETDA